jgi:hypothetical protein
MSDDSEIDDMINDIDHSINGNSPEAAGENKQDNITSKEHINEEFDGEYAASPTGNTQHLIETNDNETLCGKNLDKKDWPRSSEPGPFNPICKDCKSVLAAPVVTTDEPGMSTLNEIRNWFAERVDIRTAEEASDSNPLSKSELRLVAEYIQSLESDHDTER